MAFKTQVEIEAGKRALVERDAASSFEDHAKRTGLSRKRLVITLSGRPEVRYVTGGKMVHFRGRETGAQNDLSGVYFAADYERQGGFGADDLSDRVEALNGGELMTLAGSWSKRKWQGQDGQPRESWEFKVQRFEQGDLGLEEMERISQARLETLLASNGVDVGARERPNAAGASSGLSEERKARQRAAMSGFGAPTSDVAEVQPRSWSEEELIAAIPELLSPTKGYKAYSGIGSRETPEAICADMVAVARVLEARGLTGRSGAADRADTAFEKGAMETGERFETFLPWASFDKRTPEQIPRKAKPILMSREIEARAREIASRFHPAWDAVRRDGTPVLSAGAKSLHTRNVPQVLGEKLDAPAEVVLCYTVDGEASGGTGQAMRMASSFGVPILNFHNPRIRAAILAELGLGQERDLDRDRAVALMAAASRELLSETPQHEPATVQSTVPHQFDLRAPDVRFIADSDAAPFCKVREANGGYSNMANDHPFVVDGVTWRSTEALYQAARFPHRPDIQREIWAESSAYMAKQRAYDWIAESRKDWEDELPGGGRVKDHVMAYAITQKKQSASFSTLLEANRGKEVVEISARDPYWGAAKVQGGFRGRNQLGSLLTQLANGARMDALPSGTTFPSRAFLEGREAANDIAQGTGLPEPTIKASMYFSYAGKQRPGIKSDSTFEAIKAGERTSTTRFPSWGGYDRWRELEPGSVVRFYEDREMKGEKVDVVVLGVREIELSALSPQKIEEWSKVEGWSVDAGREFGRNHGRGLQILYDLPENVDADRIARARTKEADLGRDRAPEPANSARIASPSSDPMAERRRLQRQAMGLGIG